MKKYLSVDIYEINLNTFDMSKGFIISTGIIVLFFGGILGNFYYQNQIAPEVKSATSQAKPTLTYTPTLVPPSSTPTVYYPPSTPTPTLDPDPVIDCRFKFLGTKRMKLSECKVSLECEIDGSWYMYTSKDKCASDQKTYWENQFKSDYVAPTYSIPTYQPITIPTIPPYNSPTESSQFTQSREEVVSICQRNIRNKYKPQIDRCNRLSAGAGTYDSTERQVCISDVMKLQQIDLETCESL